MFNQYAFGTRMYEVGGYAATGKTIPAGHAVKRADSIPTTISGTTARYVFTPADTTDRPVGVASASDPAAVITPTTAGQVVLFGGAPLAAPRLSEAVVKDDNLCVKTSDGRWGKCGMGDTPVLQALEAGAAGDLIWASVL